ncbi:MAG: hypothetical protein ABI772_03710 [Bacteroidota bacterium]
MKTKIYLLIILIQVVFVFDTHAQKAVADTNKISFKNITITGDRFFDVKKVNAVITEGLGEGVRKYQLIANGLTTDYNFPLSTGLYHLLISYNDKLKASVLFLYSSDPATEIITLHFYKEGRLSLCKVTSKLSDDMNKVVILE